MNDLGRNSKTNRSIANRIAEKGVPPDGLRSVARHDADDQRTGNWHGDDPKPEVMSGRRSHLARKLAVSGHADRVEPDPLREDTTARNHRGLHRVGLGLISVSALVASLLRRSVAVMVEMPLALDENNPGSRSTDIQHIRQAEDIRPGLEVPNGGTMVMRGSDESPLHRSNRLALTDFSHLR
jgi:hypothetical protein